MILSFYNLVNYFYPYIVSVVLGVYPMALSQLSGYFLWLVLRGDWRMAVSLCTQAAGIELQGCGEGRAASAES